MLLNTLPYADHYLSADELISEIQSFFEEQDSKFFGKTWFHESLNKKFKEQLELAKQNITEDNFKKQIAFLLIQAKHSLKDTQQKYENLYQNNLWFKVPVPIRAVWGLVTGVFLFPVVIAQLYPLSLSYKDLFFKPSPAVQTAKKCRAFNKEIKRYFETMLQNCHKTKKAISTYKLIWDSEKSRKREWAYAKSHLIKDGQLSEEGKQLSLREHPELTHPFIILGGRILSMEPKIPSLVDENMKKDLINVKLAEDEYGGTWALKLKDNSVLVISN